MGQAGGGDAAALSLFEQRRLENIARNNSVLEGMGIPALVPQELRLRAASGRGASTSRKRRVVEELPSAAQDRRRSSRLANMPAVVFTTFEEDEDLGDAAGAGRASRARAPATKGGAPSAGDDGEGAPPPTGRAAGSATAGAALPGSCKGMHAHVDDLQKTCLGQLCAPEPPSGAMKATAMARLRGSAQPPRFNKYSGVQEWTNCVSLFVNVRGKAGALYNNIFLAGGRRMTWFASPKQDAETPVIQRLLSVTAADSATAVVLFIREEGCPYVYCGRLRCVQYFPASSPLKLVWELLDYDALKTAHDFAALLC